MIVQRKYARLDTIAQLSLQYMYLKLKCKVISSKSATTTVLYSSQATNKIIENAIRGNVYTLISEDSPC